MVITKEMVMRLRKETGEGIMSCKKALVKCEGDFEKAKGYLHYVGRI